MPRRFRHRPRAALTCVVVTLLALAVSGCGSGAPADAEALAAELTFHADPYEARELPAEELPYNDRLVTPLRGDRPTDPFGIPLFETADGSRHYHPVLIAQEALRLLDAYEADGGLDYLRAARLHADAVLDRAVESRGALYFPYTFDFALHGDPDDLMEAPWYSAMAQGQMLSTLVRMFQATGIDRYRDAADRVFISFLIPRDSVGMSEPWTVFVDENGYLWLEEYAKDPPLRVLNGHLFATFGLYDYYRLTDDLDALRLYRGALTTVAQYGSEFRQPGDVSLYDLRVRGVSEKYHAIHIAQLRYAAAMTGDDAFAELADQLAADSAPVDLPPSEV